MVAIKSGTVRRVLGRAQEYASDNKVPLKRAFASMGLLDCEGYKASAKDEAHFFSAYMIRKRDAWDGERLDPAKLEHWVKVSAFYGMRFRERDNVSVAREKLRQMTQGALKGKDIFSMLIGHAMEEYGLLKTGEWTKQVLGEKGRSQGLELSEQIYRQAFDILEQRDPFVPQVEGRIRLRTGEEALMGGQLQWVEGFERCDIPAILSLFSFGGNFESAEANGEGAEKVFIYERRPKIEVPSGADILLRNFYQPGAPREIPWKRQIFYKGTKIFERRFTEGACQVPR